MELLVALVVLVAGVAIGIGLAGSLGGRGRSAGGSPNVSFDRGSGRLDFNLPGQWEAIAGLVGPEAADEIRRQVAGGQGRAITITRTAQLRPDGRPLVAADTGQSAETPTEARTYLVDGQRYPTIDAIPFGDLRAALRAADASGHDWLVLLEPGSTDRPINRAVDSAAPTGTTTYEVDGVSYSSVDAIPDAAVRELVEDLEDRLPDAEPPGGPRSGETKT
jgi:hypothetical protein